MERDGLVIRRVKKVKKGGHHGGAWKIALADFALAMMAFFLVLWVINVSSPQQLAAIQGYFNDPMGPSTAGYSASPIDLGGSPAKSNQKKLDLQLPEPGSTAKPTKELKRDIGGGVKSEDQSEQQKEELAKKLESMDIIQANKDNIKIDITPMGVRITLLDDPRDPMFERGSARMMPDMVNTLLSMSRFFNKVSNPLVITGHTDATRYNDKSRLDNWDLSSMRANAARRILEEGGVKDGRIAQVIGLSDTVPYNRFNPDSPQNRRISITLLTDKAYKALLERNRLNYGPSAKQSEYDLKPQNVF
ncbi:Chemotaxis protein LafU [Marinomonas spartinae]|uniref:Chemotaxis protein LafU n=1 Tax=Marinomonas spartinae TaxID=1792290 RepID=A0A1A8TDQ5_9GAMM|nr:flagellar motor protein MotB [Marinomonas spartinae]SBS30158.1 Chemotaxis protein LafU [Marinomonas spartinae]